MGEEQFQMGDDVDGSKPQLVRCYVVTFIKRKVSSQNCLQKVRRPKLSARALSFVLSC